MDSASLTTTSVADGAAHFGWKPKPSRRRQLLPEMLMASRRGLHRTTNHRDLALDPPDHIHPGPHVNVSSILLSISRA